MTDTQEPVAQKRQRKPKTDQEYAADSLSRLHPKTQGYLRGLGADELHTFVQNSAARKPKRVPKEQQPLTDPVPQPKAGAKIAARPAQGAQVGQAGQAAKAQAESAQAPKVAKARASRAKPKIVKDDA
ncbi:MAG: hypothetical protein LBD75_00240 [Candidatus Peribacteria bacterium]|nr:hypothetical protein [Candidatus Peribacteria bacterium]